MTDRAGARWDEWYMADYRRETVSDEEDTMHIRLSVMAQKIALIYAISDRADAIDLPHIDAALTLIEWMWTNVRKLVRTWGETPDQNLSRKVVSTLERRGPLSKRALQQGIGHRMGPNIFARTIKSMLENETLTILEDGRIALLEDA